jgi:hypothetical protein
MIMMKLATAGLLGMVAVSALAQAPAMDPAGVQAGLNHGNRDSLPLSTKASNIVPADTSGTTAPTLPSSALGLDASSREYLRAARASLVAGHTGAAQQSLEMAETRVLGGSDSPDHAKLASGNPQVAEIRDALHALGGGDRAHAIQIIDVALAN